MRVSEPSDRNYEIFCDVEWGGHSLRAAAEAHGLSPTRIQQIVAQVRHWYNANLPAWVKAEHPVAVACVAKRVFEERAQFLYNEAMSAWRDSRQEFTIRREKPGRVDGTTVTTSRSFGQARYIAQAMRVAQANLAASYDHALILQRLGVTPDDDEPSAPPEEVCAQDDDQATDEAVESATAPEVNESDETSCESAPDVASEPMVALANPVRSRHERKLARHEKRKAARQRQRARRGG